MFLVDRVYIVHTGRRSPSYVMRRQHVMTPVSRESRRIVRLFIEITRKGLRLFRVFLYASARPECWRHYVLWLSVRPFVRSLANL